MSISGILFKTCVVLGAAAIGVEYGRRHPDDAWQHLYGRIKQDVAKVRAKFAAQDDPTVPVEEVKAEPVTGEYIKPGVQILERDMDEVEVRVEPNSENKDADTAKA